MHYPRKNSPIKKRRKQGFRARMKTSKGRRMINRQRRRGRHSLNPAAAK
jgi:large subunit ribosomal protein L34